MYTMAMSLGLPVCTFTCNMEGGREETREGVINVCGDLNADTVHDHLK